jgi:hypothetical protein
MTNKFLKILSFFTFPAIVFFINLFLDLCLNLYFVFNWLDIPMHFIGGFSVGYMVILFLRFWKQEKLLNVENKLIFVFIVIGAVSLIAILWEFYEFFISLFFNGNILYEDTLFDLFMGVFGSLVVSVFSKI